MKDEIMRPNVLSLRASIRPEVTEYFLQSRSKFLLLRVSQFLT